ncbi:MAG: hypothetical protein ACOVLH_09185 [Roseateles sp.]
MAQARQHPPLSRLAVLLLMLAAPLVQASPRAAACVQTLEPVQQPEPAASEVHGDKLAQARFEQCAAERFGATALPLAPRCAADLAELPVILLYRVDGLSRAEAQADLQRAGQLDDGSEYARRAPLMLSFGYQGAGPQKGRVSEWMTARLAEWTERCLSGRLSAVRP